MNLKVSEEISFFATDLGMEPWSLYSAYSSKGNLYKNVFTQPLYLGKDGNINPGLFKSWAWDEKTLSYLFELNLNYNFGQNRELRPSDIEFLFLKPFLSKNDYKINSFLLSLKGVSQLKRGEKFKSGMCDCIEIKSPSEIKVYLSQKNPFFLKELADFYFPVAPIEDFNDDMYSFKSIPRGTGFYKIANFDKTKVVATLHLKNDFKVKKIPNSAPRLIQFYNGGDPKKIMPTIASASATLDDISDYDKAYSEMPDAIQFIDFNFENKYGANPEFREAISLAIDREKIVAVMNTKKIPHTSLITNSKLGLKEPSRNFNKEKSAQIINRTFIKLKNSERPLKALYYGSAKKNKPNQYAEIERQLAEIGIKIKFEPSDFTSLDKGKDDDVVMITYSKILPYSDYMYSFYNYSKSNKGFVNYDPNNTEMHSLFKRASTAKDKGTRLKLASNLAHLHAKHFIQVPLFLSFPFYYKNKSVDSLNINNPEGLVDFTEVSFKNKKL